MLLAGYYVYRVRPQTLCRAASARYREFDMQMFRACAMINNMMLRIVRTKVISDNTQDNSTTGHSIE